MKIEMTEQFFVKFSNIFNQNRLNQFLSIFMRTDGTILIGVLQAYERP
jgi:hypothetical protein